MSSSAHESGGARDEATQPQSSDNGMDKSNHNAAAWTILALNLVESLSLAATNLFSQPNLTMCVFLPASFFAGRFELVSTPVGIIVAGGLVGLAYVSGRKFKKTQAKYQGSGGDQGSRAPPPLWDDSTSSKKEDNKDTFRKRAESVEWLNQFVRHVWLRYPNLVGDWLIRDVILGEILEGLRRDKVLPAGPIKDILCTKVILRDASPWVLDAEVNPTRSPDELQLMARVRFVSDQDTGVELKIKVSAGIVIPVKIEQISVETRLILRFYLQDEAPFIRVIWLSMMEKPTLDLAILPLGGVDVMKIPGLDTMIHDIIMQGIMSEIVLPAGKIIALKPKMPDEYYKEWGNIPSALDEYSGEMILNISQTRVMLHPAFRENDDMDLYIRVSVDGKQVHRSHKILNTVSETGNFRFNLFVPLNQPEGGSKIELQLVCADNKRCNIQSVALGSILMDDVVDAGKFYDESWLDVAAITNGALKLRCRYAPFRPSLKTITSQHSNSKDFCGGKCDWQDAEAHNLKSKKTDTVLKTAADFAQVRHSARGALRSAAPLASPHKSLPDAEVRILTQKSAARVTVHSASNLISKMIGTRDPYVRLVIGDQAEKTSAKLNDTNPKWEEVMFFLLDDTTSNDELSITVHQDDVSRGWSVADDAIGTYSFSMKQLRTVCHGAWSGTVALKKVRAGKVSLTMSIATIRDTLAVGKQREKSGVSEVEVDGGSGIADCLRIQQPLVANNGPPVMAVLQVKVLTATCQVYDTKNKNYDKIPHPYLKIAVGNGKTWQNCDTRVVRSTREPVFNEYFEFFVRDVGRDSVAFSFESRDGFFTEILGTLKVPMPSIARSEVLAQVSMPSVARGEVLQKWLPFKGEGAHKASVLLEMRLAFLEWDGQDPPATQKWKQKYAGGPQQQVPAGGLQQQQQQQHAPHDNIEIDEDADSEWSLLVDVSKEKDAKRGDGAEDELNEEAIHDDVVFKRVSPHDAREQQAPPPSSSALDVEMDGMRDDSWCLGAAHASPPSASLASASSASASAAAAAVEAPDSQAQAPKDKHA